jgi:hypothetical protein
VALAGEEVQEGLADLGDGGGRLLGHGVLRAARDGTAKAGRQGAEGALGEAVDYRFGPLERRPGGA